MYGLKHSLPISISCGMALVRAFIIASSLFVVTACRSTYELETAENSAVTPSVISDLLPPSTDGQWIVFDCSIPSEGGEALRLTQSRAPVINYHPGYSSDGSQIAFILSRCEPCGHVGASLSKTGFSNTAFYVIKQSAIS